LIRLLWEVDHHWASVKAFKVVAIEDEDRPLFDLEEKTNGNHTTEDVAKASPYLGGFVKWDGCTELDQGRPHWCGPREYIQHFNLLRFIYERAFELMGREPEESFPKSHTVKQQPPTEVIDGIPWVVTEQMTRTDTAKP